MSTQLPIDQNNSDSQILRTNLDQKRSAILVVERDQPETIMTLEGYVNGEKWGPDSLNRNRVRYSLFGNEEQKRDYDIDDIQIYRSE